MTLLNIIRHLFPRKRGVNAVNLKVIVVDNRP
jgi:hypothetical protein